MEKNLEYAVYVSWEESERGWGERPDGFSLHLTEADAQAFIGDYWNSMPDKIGGMAPDEYSRPAGNPFVVQVSGKLYGEIKKTKNGIRCYDRKLALGGEISFPFKRTGWQ